MPKKLAKKGNYRVAAVAASGKSALEPKLVAAEFFMNESLDYVLDLARELSKERGVDAVEVIQVTSRKTKAPGTGWEFLANGKKITAREFIGKLNKKK